MTRAMLIWQESGKDHISDMEQYQALQLQQQRHVRERRRRQPHTRVLGSSATSRLRHLQTCRMKRPRPASLG